MNTREKRAIKSGFPFGFYLKQLFSADAYARYINPFSFWRRYRINHLETCRELDIVKYLEDCHQLDCQVIKHTNIRLDRDCINASANSLLKQAELNTIYISQPRIKLKYRGVSYYIRGIADVKINRLKIDPCVVEIKSLEQSSDLNNSNTPEKSGSN